MCEDDVELSAAKYSKSREVDDKPVLDDGVVELLEQNVSVAMAVFKVLSNGYFPLLQ